MKGKHQVIIKNRRVSYTLELNRNITVILGDSGTGKTTLINALQNYEELGPQSGVSVSSDKPCHVLHGSDWMEKLARWESSIVFLDEGNAFIKSQDFADAIRGSDHYYVLITRESLYQLPYSVDAVLELKKTTSRFHCTYNRAYPYYDHVRNLKERLPHLDGILTEDSGSGQQMFRVIGNHFGVRCFTANGKSNLLKTISENQKDRLLVVADGAAFGAEMGKIYQYQIMHPDAVVLYLPESFEWLILKAGVVSSDEIRAILDDPANYIDGKEYFSWEQYFTDLLVHETTDSYTAYAKDHLQEYYLQDKNVQKVIREIEG